MDAKLRAVEGQEMKTLSQRKLHGAYAVLSGLFVPRIVVRCTLPYKASQMYKTNISKE